MTCTLPVPWPEATTSLQRCSTDAGGKDQGVVGIAVGSGSTSNRADRFEMLKICPRSKVAETLLNVPSATVKR